MRTLFTLAVAVWPAAALFGQAALQEPPDFPNVYPGPGVLRPGTSPCFLLASGAIVPGDVDWVQVTLPRASLQTVVDLDFPTGGGSSAASSLLVFVAGGATFFGNADNNGPNDNFCGLGSMSVPLGSTLDSAIALGATPRNAVVHIGITGAGDAGFSGMHSKTFTYNLWVYVVPGPCVANSDCYDGVGCTVETCVLPGGSCLNTPSNAVCDDGSFCNGAELCDSTLGCQAGTPPNCDDGIGCTVDACSDAVSACLHTPNDAACDDNAYCNGVETCVAGVGCQPGMQPDCDDGVPCTVDTCDAALNACVHTPVDALCDDGSQCSGKEHCNAALGCQAGTPLVCDDGVFCNGQETCDPVGGCVAGADPCPGQFCRESEARCVDCETDADCDDGMFCNGAEVCDAAGTCHPGTPPSCDDAVKCTADTCDPVLNACVHAPVDVLCDDGSVCNGVEHCDAQLDCVAGPPLMCDDGVFCNGQESCDAVGGCVAGADPCPGLFCREDEMRCVECQTDADCDDGDFCNGTERCDASGACQAGAPPCGPGEMCNADAGQCEALVSLDLQRGACPNQLSASSRGNLSVALLVAAGLDPGRVDLSSLQLRRADGRGGAALPAERRGRRPELVTNTVGFSGACGCQPPNHALAGALLLTFNAEDVGSLLAVGNPRQGAAVQLVLSGRMMSGTPFAAADCATVVGIGHR